MRCKLTKIILFLVLCLLALLAACGRAPAKTQAPEEAPAQWEPETILAVAGEESAPPETPDGPTDGLEGSYYND